MKASNKKLEAFLGGLIAFSGPSIGFLIYSLFFGNYVNSLTIIPYIVIITSVTIILVIMVEKFIKNM